METLKNIPVSIKEFKPYLILSVPALAKNFKKNIEQGIRAQGKNITRLFYFALKVAYIYNGDGGEDKGCLLYTSFHRRNPILQKKGRYIGKRYIWVTKVTLHALKS